MEGVRGLLGQGARRDGLGSKHRRPVTHLAQALHLAEDARSAFGKPQAPCEAAATCSRRARATSLRPCLPPGSPRACAEIQPWGTYWRATSAVRDVQKASESFGLTYRPVGPSRACGSTLRLTAVSHRAGPQGCANKMRDVVVLAATVTAGIPTACANAPSTAVDSLRTKAQGLSAPLPCLCKA